MIRINSARTIDIPIAEINGANLLEPLFLSLLYATNSRIIDKTPETNIDPKGNIVKIK